MGNYTLEWDKNSERLYETGVRECALYVYGTESYNAGVAWNGITAITESPSGAEETALYADDAKYLSLRSAEELGGTIEAYMYPDEWAVCDGSWSSKGVKIGQQPRKKFALAYTTRVGNDTDGTGYGEKLHVIYEATASPSERAYASINDSPEAITFSWEFSTTPIATGVSGVTNKASMVTIDSHYWDSTNSKYAATPHYEDLKKALFGDKSGTGTAKTPTLKTPSEIYAIVDAAVVENADG